MTNKTTSPASSKHKMPSKLRLKLSNECNDLLKKTKLNSSFKEFKFHLAESKQIDELTYKRMMNLFEALMREAYESSSWGWNETEKLNEWKHHRTRVMFVTKNETLESTISDEKIPSEDEEIIAFMCFRYEVGADKSECALYVYELHVDPTYQRQGLGGELMRMAKVLAQDFKMDKIMLTVFRSNQPALQFYNKLKFFTDKSSPAKNEADYMILSFKLKI